MRHANTVNLENLVKQSGIQDVISIGINMKCKKIITKSKLGIKDGIFYIINGGVRMRCDDINDVLLDTPENREILKHKIK